MRELASLWIHRRVLTSLARHHLRRSYAGTATGMAWAVLAPLVPLLILTSVFSLGLRLPLGGANYIFGFAVAYVPWVLLSSSITAAAMSILSHRNLVKRIVFPIEIVPAEATLVHSLSHAILVALTAIVCFVAGHTRFPELLLIPYFYVCAALLSVSCGLFFASLVVIVRDAQQVLPSVLNVWFWVTPVAWSSLALPPAGQTLLSLNPASYVVTGYRFALLPELFPPPGRFETIAFWSVAVAMLIVASALFRRARPHFWDCL